MGKSLFDPSFRYTPSYATNLRKTFARVRQQRQQQERQPEAKVAAPIRRVK